MAFQELDIQELGPKADGLAVSIRDGGPVAYVDRAVPGDRLLARVRRDPAGVPRGEIVELLEPSPYRQTPPCGHYARCGNCTLQHVTPDFYREFQRHLVERAFERQGLRPERWLEPVFLGGANRRRATFATYRDGGRVALGYYRRRSRQIAPIETCLVAAPELLRVRDLVRPLLAPFLPPSGPVDVFLQVVGTGAGAAADLAITGPVGRRGVPDDAVLAAAETLLALTPVARVSWRAEEAEPFTILAGVADEPRLVAAFGPLAVALPPAAFLQPTAEGEAALVRAVLEALPGDGGRFADLFSGAGTFSGPMLERGSVDAYEAGPEAVRALSRAAGGKPLRAFRRDLFRRPLGRAELDRYDAVVFDPPRGGCPEQAAEMAGAKTGTLVGVSCNPATFARDARLLVRGGYRLESLRLVDQFLWSHHVEVVGVFRKGHSLQ